MGAWKFRMLETLTVHCSGRLLLIRWLGVGVKQEHLRHGRWCGAEINKGIAVHCRTFQELCQTLDLLINVPVWVKDNTRTGPCMMLLTTFSVCRLM